MTDMGLKPPKKKNINPRARFYFTEKGWNEVGRKLFDLACEQHYHPKIIRLKNPKRSDVVYADPYQVAVLPNKR